MINFIPAGGKIEIVFSGLAGPMRKEDMKYGTVQA